MSRLMSRMSNHNYSLLITHYSLISSRRYIVLLMGIVATVAVMANGVDRNEALKKAQKCLPGRQFTESKTVASARGRASGGTDAFYVFNAENNGGYVIVSGDDRTKEILGYATYGNLDTDHLPDNLKWWLDSYAAQIAALGTGMRPAAQTALGSAIEPLIQSKWDQEWPYNKMCPDGNYVDYDEDGYETYNRCLAGCVPTAMAQVMYYWKWPENCPALDEYMVKSGNSLKALPETTFKWAQMTDTYSYQSTEEATDAVAELMRYCGQAVQVRYSTGSTSGYADPSVLIKTFGYSKSMRELMRDDYTISQWEAMVYQELAAKRPILYHGASDWGSHLFIVDGYDGQGLFHINWGWSGIPDSYYVLSLADPGTDHGMPYHYSQKGLFYMQPGKDGDVMTPLLRMADSKYYSSDVKNTYVQEDANTDFADVFLSLGIYTQYATEPESEIDAEVGWALYQGDELKQVVGSMATTIPAEKDDIVYDEMTVSFGAGLPEGKYQLTPVFRLPGMTEWERCEGYAINSLMAEVTPTTLIVRAPDKENMSFAVNSMSVSDYLEAGSEACVSANITNDGETQQLIALLWIQKEGEEDWSVCSKATTYADYGMSTDISLKFTTLEAGTFNLKLTTWYSEDALKTATFTVATYEEVVVEGLIYRCAPDYGRATVINNPEADTNVERVNIQQTVECGGVDCKVVAIGEGAFSGWRLTSLTIPEGVETIGSQAFMNCDNLVKIVLPSTVTEIGSYAFYNTTNLSFLVSHIQDPPQIGQKTFMYQLGDYITNAIGIYPSKATLYVPDGSRTKYEALTGWNQFKAIEEGDLKEAVVDGIRYAYVTKGTTATVVKDDGYKEITEGTITIPATVVIGKKTFQVTALGYEAFQGCQAKISLPEGLETIGEEALAATGIDEIILPSTLKTIGREAFWGSRLKGLSVPEGVETIEEGAFSFMNSLTWLRLPSSLKEIGLNVIKDCDRLTTVFSKITDPSAVNSRTFILTEEWQGDSWQYLPSRATLYVPEGKVAAYQGQVGWNCFADIKEMGAAGDLNGDGVGNVADIVYHVNALMNQDSVFVPIADFNNNGIIDATETMKVVTLILMAK